MNEPGPPIIKDTPNLSTKSASVYQKEDNLSTKDKRLGPKCVHYLEGSTVSTHTPCK